jgi:hypothetical protein
MKYYSKKQNTSVAHITVLHNENVKNLTLRDTDLELLVFITRSYIIYILSVKIIGGRNQSTRFSLVYGDKRDFRQYFSYIVAVSFIGGGHQSTRKKSSTCRKSLTNFII